MQYFLQFSQTRFHFREWNGLGEVAKFTSNTPRTGVQFFAELLFCDLGCFQVGSFVGRVHRPPNLPMNSSKTCWASTRKKKFHGLKFGSGFSDMILGYRDAWELVLFEPTRNRLVLKRKKKEEKNFEKLDLKLKNIEKLFLNKVVEINVERCRDVNERFYNVDNEF